MPYQLISPSAVGKLTGAGESGESTVVSPIAGSYGFSP